jgi:hypothetical protein
MNLKLSPGPSRPVLPFKKKCHRRKSAAGPLLSLRLRVAKLSPAARPRLSFRPPSAADKENNRQRSSPPRLRLSPARYAPLLLLRPSWPRREGNAEEAASSAAANEVRHLAKPCLISFLGFPPCPPLLLVFAQLRRGVSGGTSSEHAACFLPSSSVYCLRHDEPPLLDPRLTPWSNNE